MGANLREEGECSHKVRKIEKKGTGAPSHPFLQPYVEFELF